MTEPTWREIRELTRLRRRQAHPVRYSAETIVTRQIAAYDAKPDLTAWGLIVTPRDNDLWYFQCGKCYICGVRFSRAKLATREHVTPKARGGKNVDNLLLACIECNNIKADRPPTNRELQLLRLYNEGDRNRFHHVLTYNSPTPESIKRRSLTQRRKRG